MIVIPIKKDKCFGSSVKSNKYLVVYFEFGSIKFILKLNYF